MTGRRGLTHRSQVVSSVTGSALRSHAVVDVELAVGPSAVAAFVAAVTVGRSRHCNRREGHMVSGAVSKIRVKTCHIAISYDFWPGRVAALSLVWFTVLSLWAPYDIHPCARNLS